MSEPSLRQVQQWMKARIQPWTDARPADDKMVRLNPQRGTPGLERLAVYAGGYVARTHDALKDVYPTVHHVVGEGDFFELAEAYARHDASREYNLNFLGGHLPAFLPAWPLTERLPFLPDLARLEWLVCMAFHAFDEPPLDPTPLTSCSPAQWGALRLIPQPSVGLVASAWPIRDIWAARTQPRDSINVELRDRPQRVLVFRRDLQVTCELLEELEYRVLDRLLGGERLGVVCSELSRQSGVQAGSLTDWFARWSRQGLFRRYEV